MGGLLLVVSFCTLVQACNSGQVRQDFSAQDLLRMRHAGEILPSSEKRILKEVSSVRASNIQFYISEENPLLDAEKLQQTLFDVSLKLGYDPVFLLSIIKTESKFNPFSVGLAGELGLMQIKPSTAEWVCEKYGLHWKGNEALKDPSYNVYIGAHYFKYLRKALNFRGERYINAYNMGINNLQRLPASSPRKHPYYAKVISNYVDIYLSLKK